jgi:hypothetical protein
MALDIKKKFKKFKKKNLKKLKKIKKPVWYTIFTIVMVVFVFIIAAALIYSTFFESNINKERNKKYAQEYMTEKLESNSKEAKVYREENEALIKKYDLDIFGRYTCTFNELEKSEDGQTESSYTTEVTRVMEIKKDSTAIFDDGTKGWWMLKETEGGIVHMGLVLPEEKNPQIFLVCKDKLIDETKACFLGEVPDKNRFNASFSAGNFTLEFSADGSIDGEYTEIIKENGTEYPRTEAYSGSYERDGDYLNIVLNGADAKYLIFETENEKSEIQVKGFASRYYQRIGKDK